jgi:hypothetical protein
MAKRSSNRGRNLKRTETQAKVNVSRYVSGERGRTNGIESLSAVAASSPRLRRKPPNSYVRLMPDLRPITLEEVIHNDAGRATR